ncbi:MAG: hypothetical protein H0T84_12625, partial [Tatlockia sp.]|nr:hypothetical protein [Tatlockia sp.]
MAKDTDILVVGAGPIGLINAWGMKRLNPDLNIVILEKYTEYQRSHTLVMEPLQLAAIMKATNSEQDKKLIELLKQLNDDPNIRTNALQQIFTKLAEESGIEIHTEQEVKAETINQLIDLEYPNLKLIIGADGTHSVVSDTLFPEGNQIKHEFDFVLQLRFEITGEEKAQGSRMQKFYAQMARKGLIANEYVGHFKDGKTPVTMQMMISKEDFIALKSATSKNPLKPFVDEKSENSPKVPKQLISFIEQYLIDKIYDTKEAGLEIDKSTIRISVNEAPATHAKKVVTTRNQTRIVLEGDSALGLSYFKGLNAGLEASARFLSTISTSIQNSFSDKKAMDEQLENYQKWFLGEFSPKKVHEVSQYSFWQIRSVMGFIKTTKSVIEKSRVDDDMDLNPAIADYFNYFIKDSVNKDKSWRPFPHREYDLVDFGQLDYVPLKHTAKKIIKIFADYFKPYKSTAQLAQDYKQPFVGFANFWIGFGKIFAGIFTANLWISVDGLLTMVRGTVEMVTTPLTYLIKPVFRLIATFIHGGPQKIEENRGLHRLAEYGQELLNQTEDYELGSNQTMYELLAVCNDMHRKFDKSFS